MPFHEGNEAKVVDALKCETTVQAVEEKMDEFFAEVDASVSSIAKATNGDDDLVRFCGRGRGEGARCVGWREVAKLARFIQMLFVL